MQYVNNCKLLNTSCPTSRHFAGTGVTTYSLHPGVIRTELVRHLWPTMPLWKRFVYKPLMFLMKSPTEGAQTTIYCAVEESLQNESGLYYRSVIVNQLHYQRHQYHHMEQKIRCQAPVHFLLLPLSVRCVWYAIYA